MDDIPNFDDGLARFRDFLHRAGFTKPIRWIWREEVLSRCVPGARSCHRPIHIDFSRPNDEASVRKRYNAAVKRGWGMAFCVVCSCDEVPCCYLSVPSDDVDAEQGWMTGLRCSVPVPCPFATAATDPLRLWWLRRTLGTPVDAWTTDIPSRTDVLAP